MTEATLAAATEPTEEATSGLYRNSLIALMRAHDTYGVWSKRSDDEVLEAYNARLLRRAEPSQPDGSAKSRNDAGQDTDWTGDDDDAPEEDDEDAWLR